MNIIERLQAPTPVFFKKIRTIGLLLGAVSAAVLASPLALPALAVQIASYLGVASGVASAVAQVATTSDEGGAAYQYVPAWK